MNPRTTGLLLLVALALFAFVHFYVIEGEEGRQEAEQQIKTATTLAPWNAKYFVGLGELYRASGMDSRAQRAFAEARSIASSAVFSAVSYPMVSSVP